MIYTVSVEGTIGASGSLQSAVFEGEQLIIAGGRQTDTFTVDLTNLIPDGTTSRDLATVRAVSFVAEDFLPSQGSVRRTGSIRLMNVAAPFARSGNRRSGALVGHIFRVDAGTSTNPGHVWRLSNPFHVSVQQIPSQLEVQIAGVRAGVNFGLTFEIVVD